jgi:antitoxin component of MazEF toxin-antitoxin module
MKTRYRAIRKWGNSLVIVLRPSDEMDLNLKVGDMIDIEDAVIKSSISKENKKRLNIK